VALSDTKARCQPRNPSQVVCHLFTCAIVNSQFLVSRGLRHFFVSIPQLYWLLTIEYMCLECLTHIERPTSGLPHAAFVLFSNPLTINVLAIARLKAMPSAEAVASPLKGEVFHSRIRG